MANEIDSPAVARFCTSCQIAFGTLEVPGGIVYRNDHWLVTHCIGALGLGSFVVQTCHHRPSLLELSPEELATLGPVLTEITRALHKALDAERVYISMWGEAAPHHVHMVLQPRDRDRKAAWGIKGIWLQLVRRVGGVPPASARRGVAARLYACLRDDADHHATTTERE